MDATITVICYKSKILKNGESPLMIRVSKDGKRSLKSLGVSINPVFWDFSKNQPTANYPLKAELSTLLSDCLSKYQKRLFEDKIQGIEKTAAELAEEQRPEVKHLCDRLSVTT